ncbi:MAG: hypothetical protein IKJ29_05315, partial [Akkermansia sp.]|nr:hypothetical protein [Akkermansia sp.]
MKLHLPSRLRIAVLAAFVSVFTVAPSYGDMSVQGSNGYYAKGKCVKKKLSDGSYTYTDSYEWTSLWYDPGQGKYTLAQADGTFRDIKYDKTIIFDWQYVYSRDMVHDCPGDISYTNTLHIDEDGGGNNYTWQCSKFDDEGNVTTPGVWILADTDSAVARFTNYGDMVVKDSRQESILRTIAGATEKADGTIEYNYVNNLRGIDGGKVIEKVSDISFSLAVTNTKSFTYDGGFTTGNGAFLSGSVSVLFDNLQNLTFSNNSANIGSIVWASQSSVWSGDHTGGFYVRNISGTASFNNNSGQLFRNTHSRYENVHELIFANNTHRLFASYNAPLYTEFEDCDKIVFSGNGREDATAIITNTRDSIYAGYTTFKNCGEIIFSGNIMENMLFDGATPEITNVGSVKFINNTVCDGYLIHDIGGTSVDMNITGVTDTFAIDNNNLTHLSGYATICNTDSYVSGSESKHGKLFSISGNEAYGDFRYSLNGGLFSVSHFDKFAANDNYVNSSVYGMLGNLHLSDVDAITFSNNTLYVDDGASVGGLMRGTASITDFASIEVMENFSGGEKDAKIWSSLLGEMTIVGNDEDSTKTRNSVVNIHDNMFSGKTQVVDERFSVSNVAEFAYTDNIFYCDSTASGSSGAMLTDVRIFNAGKVLVEGNISKSENGRAFGGALGGVLNSVNMEEVGVALQNSQEVVIQNNAAVGTEAAFGGAITAPQFVYISGNEKVSITGNFAKASTIADLLTEEGIGTFADTYEFNDYGKGAMGGAIYVSAGFSVEMGLAIYGNNSATIRGNYITDGKTYQLQGLAIGFGPFERRTDMMLAAPENKTLDLYDPIFASGELRIGITQTNVDDFPDYYSAEMLNKGKVVFSAAHARQDLNSIKTAANAGKVTDAEWNASRTSIVRENIFLNSGSVEVRDNAILESSSFSMGENTSLIVSSGGELRTSSFNTGYSPLLDSLSSPNVKIIMDGGSCQLSNNGIYLGTTQKLRVLSPSTINASALLLNQGSSLELVVSADNIQDACLTINFSGAKSFLMPSGYRFASAGSLTLESAETLGRGQYKLLHFEELTDSRLLAGFYENSDWADGFIVNGVGSGNSLKWVSNDDCSVDLVWTIGKTVTPPVNPDPEPEDPTPDNPPVGGDSLTWANAKKAVWQNGAAGWVEGGVFSAGDDVTFADGNVTIVGEVEPGEVTINTQKSLAFKTKYDKKTQQYSGAIAGETSVTIDAGPKAKVTMNDGNTYSGGTIIEGGSVKAGGATSFGTGAITLNGGTLDLAGKAVDNA